MGFIGAFGITLVLGAIVGLLPYVVNAGLAFIIYIAGLLVFVPFVVPKSRKMIDRLLNKKMIDLNWYWMLTVFIVVSLSSTTVLSFINAKPPTNYFIVDATAGMKPYFSDASSGVAEAATKLAQYKNGLGLRIYGGDESGISGCRNTQQLIKPQFYSDAGHQVESALAEVGPSDQSSLIIALRQVLDNDLANYTEPVHIFILTSGIPPAPSDLSPICDPRPSEYQNETTESIRNLRNSIELDIQILSIGQQDDHSSQILQTYATSFGACYQNITDLSDIAQTILTSPAYCSV